MSKQSDFRLERSAELSPETRQIAETELRESPERVKEALERLRELLKDNPDLHYADDDDTLTIFLRPCKWYPESALALFQPADGLPSLICDLCEYTIRNFYNFKQKCLEVNSKLCGINYETNQGMPEKVTIKAESCTLNNYLGNALDTWLNEETKAEMNEAYFENELREVKDEINSSFFEDKHPQEMDLTETIQKKTKILQRRNAKEVADKKPLQCEVCGKFFKTKTILDTHCLTHTGIKHFSCKLCSKQFTRAAHKVVHMRIHMGIKPYICEICGISATKRQDLIRHLRVHSDEKKYACPRCDRRFKRSGDVHTHMRTHTGARPYKCNVCEKSYTSHSGLRKHNKTHCRRVLNKIK